MTTAPRRTVPLTGDAAENLRWCAYEAMHNALELAEDGNGVSMDGFQTIIDRARLLYAAGSHIDRRTFSLSTETVEAFVAMLRELDDCYPPADHPSNGPELQEAFTGFHDRVARALGDLQAVQQDPVTGAQGR